MTASESESQENLRLQAHRLFKANWKNWGPYLSERAWGNVREDYSKDGNAWQYFPHDHARSRAYRWNEDGLGGISDRNQYLCFALSLWNGKDYILKERLFGVSNLQGNHGEDVKECYYYLDSTPTHSYMKMLYKYPQSKFPYAELIDENMKRGYRDREYELLDTGVFKDGRYFDVFIEYAKADQEDIAIEISIHNHSAFSAPCHALPTLWFRNTWSWGYPEGPMKDVPRKPKLYKGETAPSFMSLIADHPSAGRYYFYAEGSPDLIFTENETNHYLLYGTPNASPYVKDAFHRFIVNGEKQAINPAQEGTKAAAVYPLIIPSKGIATIRLRLSRNPQERPFHNLAAIIKDRKREADDFYQKFDRTHLSDEEKKILRQSFAGLLWSKQMYYFDVEQWFHGDPAYPPPPQVRRKIRNNGWEHLINFDVISMPDKWEYPWYAAWDLSFHAIALVLVDPDFAKRQLTLMTREWYMHPNGQLPAYEWDFNDVNPPVHAWAALRIYQIEAKNGEPDRSFLEGIFHKLMLNFTWWVNRKDASGNNIFQGGFLGMDNISVFDRSSPLPIGGRIDQSDGTAWMAFYCIIMMKIAIELAYKDSIYQDMATKFFEHFLRIANAMQNCGELNIALWDEEDGFFYDVLHMPDGSVRHLKVRSLVGLLPLFAVETLEPSLLSHVPVLERRMDWFINRHPILATSMASVFEPGIGNRRQLAILPLPRLKSVLSYMLDENEFLSEYGIRSLSKYHEKNPYHFSMNGQKYCIGYSPAESDAGIFGGNSNWRGPVWFPINFLIIESLQKYHHYYGDSLQMEFPTGSGRLMNLKMIARELSKRLIRLFLPNREGKRPIFGEYETLQKDPHWKDYLLFHEYFHGETGEGLGSSHQTGWTALIAKIIIQSGGKD